MKLIEIENQLREVVSRLITEVELSTKQVRQDVNLVSEDAWLPILKEVYQCPNLYNLIKKKKNYPGIDLGDDQDRVAFQITSTTSLEKIKKTLKQFKENGYKNSFDELYIFTLVNKQKSYSQTAIDKIIGDDIKFDSRKNIIDPSDILAKITSLRVGAQERLLKEFKIIHGDIKDRITNLEDQDNIPHIFASNLVGISFPDYIYSAEIDIDPAYVIDKAKEQLSFKKNKASKPLLVKLYLIILGYNTNNWVYHVRKNIYLH